jgi:hypothetical protein
MQAGFISLMGFWVGGYGGFEAVATYTEEVIISGLSLNKSIAIARLKLEKDVTIANLEV